MLPSPATFARRGPYRRHPPYRRTVDILFYRARLTNLGFFLLLFVTLVSLVCNINFLFARRHQKYATPALLLETITRHPTVRHLSHLIIVPGHAIWKGIDPDLRLNEDQWILEPYQTGGGRVSAFFAHILRGAELAKEDPESLLVFSGGQTRTTSTTTEAESYMRLALAADVFTTTTPFNRATTEDHALDSYQNLLFSIARFHEYTGRYPTKITVVGYDFKQVRFTDLHRAALRWPIEKFHYIGVDPDVVHEDVENGERTNGFVPYSQDLYGCHSILLSKRRQRNLYTRFHSYYQSAPELHDLFDWCPVGRNDLFSGSLPWVE